MQRRAPGQHGFTFVEILVAISISSAVIGTAALAYQAIGANAKRFSTIIDLDIGTDAANDYGISDGKVSVYTAPNFGKLGFALELKDKFFEDVQSASAVYCLDRVVANTVRPSTLNYPFANPGDTRPVLDTAEGFRLFLAQAIPTAASVFVPCRNVPQQSRASVFILAPSEAADAIRVAAVYDIDLVTPNGRGGIYASVKRYVNGSLTHYYDTYYGGSGGDPFVPLFVAFERTPRLSLVEGDAVDRFKVAPDQPFYFLWWPDPSFDFLTAPADTTYGAQDPRGAYGHQGGRTSLMMAVPMFPSL